MGGQVLVWVCECVSGCLYEFVCACKSMCACVRVCMSVGMCVGMGVCLSACVWVCVCIYLCTSMMKGYPGNIRIADFELDTREHMEI